MNFKYLLDTNVIVAHFRNTYDLTEKLKTTECCISAVVLGELIYGVLKSDKMQQGLSDIVELTRKLPVMHCSPDTAHRYAQIRLELTSRGTPIPENDLWIAATAMQFGLTLVTRDSHFDLIENLAKERW